MCVCERVRVRNKMREGKIDIVRECEKETELDRETDRGKTEREREREKERKRETMGDVQARFVREEIYYR